MANDSDRKDDKTPAAGKGGSPASSTPNEEARGASDDGKSSKAQTPKQGKGDSGGKGGGLH
jgi:hypothetical protein